MARIVGLLHASLLISDVARSRNFYEGILGLEANPDRPDLGFPGVWYDVGGGGQIHLLCLENPDPVSRRPEHGGRDRHTALAVEDWDGMRSALDLAGLPYTVSRSGRRALFVRDPDGNALELVAA